MAAHQAEALEVYGTARSSSGKGVTILSQRRYVQYYAALRQHVLTGKGASVADDAPTYRLSGLRLHGVPACMVRCWARVSLGNDGIACFDGATVAASPSSSTTSASESAARFDVKCEAIVRGDMCIEVCGEAGPYLRCSLHTAFLNLAGSLEFVLPRAELDLANKGKRCPT